jgi:hypothetical protein
MADIVIVVCCASWNNGGDAETPAWRAPRYISISTCASDFRVASLPGRTGRLPWHAGVAVFYRSGLFNHIFSTTGLL